ncbi:MAG: hypothetical protein NZ585_09860 [Chloracidobacterium sp.]|nr:hypothetical protein [Chloracidobacterium sp.]MDW8216916.1 hypothetical protein [Acidobacteriota bacterium]
MPILRSLIQEYKRLLTAGRAVLDELPATALYQRLPLPHHDINNRSCGEWLIAMAGGMEYVINGLLSNYWDYPAEWTMRETLATPPRLQAYLDDVISLTSKLEAVLTDADLTKVVYLPNPRQTTIGALLIERLALAAEHYGQAAALARFFTAHPDDTA